MPIERFHTEGLYHDEQNLLEYVFKVADEFAPDIIFDENGLPYEVESQAPFIFMRRYNACNLNVHFSYEDYVSENKNSNESIIDIIRALEIDPEKFWYLLLFISDYVSGSTINTMKCKPTPKQEIENLVEFIEQNVESVSKFSGASFKQAMELTVHIKGRSLKISNPNTLTAIAFFCSQSLKEIEEGSVLTSAGVYTTNVSNTKQIGLFAEMFRCFFNLYPQFTTKRKTGNNTTKSTLRLTSKLVYLAGLTANADYDSDDENLKGIIKSYRRQKLYNRQNEKYIFAKRKVHFSVFFNHLLATA